MTVTAGVSFITHDGGVWVFREKEPNIDVFGAIDIGNNVFIGMNTMILPGVKIGNNCVVGAGSVVTRSIESNSVAVGIPAKVIKSTEDYREQLRGREDFVRHYSSEEKRKWLENKFAN